MFLSADLALLHPRKARRLEIEKCTTVPLPDFTRAYLNDVLSDVRNLNQRIYACEAELLSKIEVCHLIEHRGKHFDSEIVDIFLEMI